MIELEIVSGVAKGQRLKTNSPMVSIGRSPGHTIVIDDPFVSRHHGEITLLEKGYQYRDLNSTHGTILTRTGEENYVRQVVLHGDDLLSFGGANNSLRVIDISSNDLDRRERSITVLHVQEDRFGPPEEIYAHDSKALRTIVEFDSRIMSSDLTTERQLYRALIEQIPRLFDDLDYVAVVEWTEDAIEAYDYELVDPDLKVRLSTSVVSRAEKKAHGVVYEVSREQVIREGGVETQLSAGSSIFKTPSFGNRSGICIAVEVRSQPAKYLQFEREAGHGKFRKDDVALVNAIASRVAGRIENLQLVAQNQRLNLNASMGVFAAMIGHDIKNYLFYGKKLSDIRDDPLSAHPAIAKGIERARKLAQGMKDLTAPGTVSLKEFSLQDFTGHLVDEFASLFGAECTFTADIAGDIPAITTSEDLLSRVVWNLVMNAYHSMENRPRRLTDAPVVRIEATLKNTDTVEIRIVDNAGGIGPKTFEYIERSFELIGRVYLQQEDLIDVVNEIGYMDGFTNSIGLFFTAVAINDLKGTIDAETKTGEGSVFTLRIPVKIDGLKSLLRF